MLDFGKKKEKLPDLSKEDISLLNSYIDRYVSYSIKAGNKTDETTLRHNLKIKLFCAENVASFIENQKKYTSTSKFKRFFIDQREISLLRKKHLKEQERRSHEWKLSMDEENICFKAGRSR